MSQLSIFDTLDMAITPAVPGANLTVARTRPAAVPARKIRGRRARPLSVNSARWPRICGAVRFFATSSPSRPASWTWSAFTHQKVGRAAARLLRVTSRRISTGCTRCLPCWFRRCLKRTRTFWVRCTWRLSWEPMRWGSTSRLITFHRCWRSWPPVNYWRS